MRIFVTGATGFIGSAIVRELRQAGHDVVGLARSDAAAETLANAGATAHRGDLSDPASLAAAARACDGVIHTAFIHDFTRFDASVATDRAAVTALLDALEGTDKPFVTTSVTALLSSAGRIGTERDVAIQGSTHTQRAAAEAMVLAAADRGVRTSAVRLPPSVHGAGDYGFVPMLIATARRTGFAGYVGDGANRWPAVHRFDAARLYRLALENAAPATVLHAVAEEGVPMRAIAETIGAGLGLPVRSLTPEEGSAHFDWFVHFIAMDNPASSAITRETLGWTPQQPELLTDMRENGYFG
jgi:nucleoside-diphosphate-sugar epimerase